MIKAEALWTGETLGRSNQFAARNGGAVRIRDADGQWQGVFNGLAAFDSMMTHCNDPGEGLELLIVRERMRDWRFYDHFRTDPAAPARRPQVGTHTAVLASDGADLAAAIQTIREIGDAAAFDEAMGDAFAGAEIRIDIAGGYFDVAMRQHGLLRWLRSAELSDEHLALPAAGGGASLAAAAIADGAQRTRDQPAPRPAGAPGPADRQGVPDLPNPGRHPCRGLGPGPGGRGRLPRAGAPEKELGETLVDQDESPAWSWPSR